MYPSIISKVENKKEKRLVKTDKINVALGICGVFILFLIFFLIAFFVKFFNNSPFFGYTDYRTQL